MYKDPKQTTLYAVRHWRKTSEAEETLEDFLFWLEYDAESPDVGKETINSIKALIDQYLGRDMQKIAQGERELLDAWIKASTIENRR